VVLDRQGQRAAATRLLSEALGLAAIAGLARLLPEAHPQAVALVDELLAADRPSPTGAEQVVAMSPPPVPGLRPDLLTSKEAEILDLLGKGMSNKEIARVLDISAETVKWHLKNLFAKLSAGTRRHVVERARLLGLIPA
jgi:LuxR family maltose regulon positive regulatory protein